ncbi:MAG: hypothetical protein N4A33_03655 [Bacteriovoracaceae bacterium]|jgi:hypothetical protein|nr:hypothetical protein [Bacteriovoracaceae bacterium]
MRKKKGFISFLLISTLINTGFILLKPQVSYTLKKDKDISNESRLYVKLRSFGKRKATGKKNTIKVADLFKTQSDLLIPKSIVKSNNFELTNSTKSRNPNKKIITKTFKEKIGTTKNIIVNTGVKYEAKEGVELDELNKHELVYYGFRARNAKQYYNSAFKNLNELKRKFGSLLIKNGTHSHKMRGIIKYDKDGNVLSIRILDSSDKKIIHDYFVKTLKDIKAISNPPKGFAQNGFQATYLLNLTI